LALPVQKTRRSTNNCSQFLFVRYTAYENREQTELAASWNGIRIKSAEGFALQIMQVLQHSGDDECHLHWHSEFRILVTVHRLLFVSHNKQRILFVCLTINSGYCLCVSQ
jgi:hypothetical protein